MIEHLDDMQWWAEFLGGPAVTLLIVWIVWLRFGRGPSSSRDAGGNVYDIGALISDLREEKMRSADLARKVEDLERKIADMEAREKLLLTLVQRMFPAATAAAVDPRSIHVRENMECNQ